MSKIITIDEYTSIKLEDNGQYGWKIVEGWIGKDGEFKARVCQRRFKKDGEEKMAPVSIKLGDKPRHILQQMIDSIGGQSPDDIPF